MKPLGFSPKAYLFYGDAPARRLYCIVFSPYPIKRDRVAERNACRRRWKKRDRQQARRDILAQIEEAWASLEESWISDRTA